jgi:riboflavin synthase
VFTGLIADLGTVASVERSRDGVRLGVRSALAAELDEGDSVAVNGVCLTAVEVVADGAAAASFSADVMNETLRFTSLADVEVDTQVNLELAMRPADRLGGHIVQGHVDAIGWVLGVAEDGFSRRLTIGAPPELLRYVARKGSIAVDGVSLTVAEITDESFTVSLIPETLQRTNLGVAEAGRTVNLETDVLAKYVERLINR